MTVRSFGVALCFALCLAALSAPAHAQNTAVTRQEDGSVRVEGADEAAAELKAILQGGKGKETDARADRTPGMDYDAEIAKAMKAGEAIKAATLRSCKDVPPGTTVTVAPAFAAVMRQYCLQREFDIAVDPRQLHKGPIRSDPPPGSAQKGGTGRDPAVEACRRETLDHVITCAKVTDYLNCETWGCPEIIQCDKRLTRCDDHGAPYDRSGNFYCDTRNWRTRDFDLNVLLAETCPE